MDDFDFAGVTTSQSGGILGNNNQTRKFFQMDDFDFAGVTTSQTRGNVGNDFDFAGVTTSQSGIFYRWTASTLQG